MSTPKHTNPQEIADIGKETTNDGAIDRLIAQFEEASQNEDGIEKCL